MKLIRKARIDKTVMFVQSVQPNDIDGSEGRDITLTLGEHTMSFKGPALSGAFRAAQLLFPLHHGLRHPAALRC